MPLQATSGAASYDAFGGGVAVLPKYIEDYFSTFLYSGAGTTQAINNGVDLSAKGGLVWLKDRGNVGSHRLVDTVRGNRNTLFSDSTSAAVTRSNDVSCDVSSFNSNGFTAGNFMNQASNNYVSWSFAEAPKFFDVVTYTGNGASSRAISHALGSAPGCMIVKRTDSSNNWNVYHRSQGATKYGALNMTDPFDVWSVQWANTEPTATEFTVGVANNASGATYVAYVFAHNAGGFGLTGTDNVISCGSFTTNGSGQATVSLGYEPQWVMMKRSDGVEGWWMTDNMRGNSLTSYAYLYANAGDAEVAGSGTYVMAPTATGFLANNLNVSATYIYIAIRRGPMRTPTTGTSVFAPVTYTGNAAAERTITSAVNAPDFSLTQQRNRAGWTNSIYDRLRGNNRRLITSSTAAESGANGLLLQNGITLSAVDDNNASGIDYINYFFQRAPGFFDEVCYTGTGVNRTVAHNLTVPPELMVIKVRTPGGYAWRVYAAPLGITQSLVLNTTAASVTDTYWNGTAPTSTVFSVNDYGQVNNSGSPIVAYLFASCPGVSKVGSYTGNGTSQTIDCGFTGGARFILIKCSNGAGDWIVWDTARGIFPGNDPELYLNTTDTEQQYIDSVDTTASGFIVNGVVINASGSNYIFLAIA